MDSIESVLSQCLVGFSRLINDGSIGHFQEEVSLRQWEDELGRLRVWSGNIGAHKSGQSSLDYRLRDASHIRDEVIRLLRCMRDLFQDLEEVLDEGEVEERLSSPDGDLDLDESHDLTEVQQIYQSLVEIINFLFRLSIAIRKPAHHDQLVGMRVGEAAFFKPWARQHITHKFPHAEDEVISRLCTAMASQKAVLKYRERHRQKLGMGLLPSTEVSSTILSDTVATEPADITIDPLQSLESLSNSGASQTSYALSLVASQESLSIPPLPKSCAAGQPFECPYCRHIISIWKHKDWARHIFRDLKPYICLFTDCSTPSRLYNSRRQWYHHLVEEHSLQGDVATSSICPLCRCEILSAKSFERHVGRHLEELALFVLPRNHDEDEDIPENSCHAASVAVAVDNHTVVEDLSADDTDSQSEDDEILSYPIDLEDLPMGSPVKTPVEGIPGQEPPAFQRSSELLPATEGLLGLSRQSSAPAADSAQYQPSKSESARIKGDTKVHPDVPEVTVPSASELQCSICGKVFTRRSNCHEHMKRHDPSRKNLHRCDYCGKTFGRNGDLRRHKDAVCS
ncbi:predicted protein [Aspergillus terreus NIH2624]|uniref:C2H2-type domain-containing protein n=1 Tax=Aspergillus terreus (strain NIH 2624 / FGSC A1156) TaxID=341663 RepID=Q0CFZ6_ASPTN|nr:uncharacterized protein ATEG_07396 [Aspergillus terreus NIH2624]EAU32780.1 predicted protein [Aspergillus terreus NIH2624]